MNGEGNLPEKERGIDGLNLVEFPLSVLSGRAPSDQSTLTFSDTFEQQGTVLERRMTIRGADGLGLPSYKHHDLLVGLIQLTKEKNGFASPRVEFTRYELLDILGWDSSGYYYRLAKDALSIWKGVSIFYEDAWWVDGVFRTKAISVISEFELYGTRDGARRTKAQLVDCPSYIVWGDTVFAEFRDKRTKGLDYDFYRSLKSSVSRQLFRYLDKWFYFGPTYRHDDLRVFACEKIGLSRNYDNSNLIRKLEKGLRELEDGGFLKPQKTKDRFPKVGWGKYGVQLEKAERRHTAGVGEGLAEELVKRGVTDVAAELVKKYPREKIEQAIENFDDRRASGEEVTAGFLVADIRSDSGYSFRRGYRSKAKREAERAAAAVRGAEESAKRESVRLQVAEAADAETRELHTFLSELPSDLARADFERRALLAYRFQEQLERARTAVRKAKSNEERTRATESYETHREVALKAYLRRVRGEGGSVSRKNPAQIAP